MLQHEGELADKPVFDKQRFGKSYAGVEVEVGHRHRFLQHIPKHLLGVEQVQVCAPRQCGFGEPLGYGDLKFHIGVLAGWFWPDGGAEQFAKTVAAIRRLCPSATVETLISDMKFNTDALDVVIASHPDVLNHNVETVKSLQKAVRPQADYERSLGVLRYCKQKDPTLLTKTGFMVGLGETEDEISELMDDILKTGCDILTIGQYLQPSPEHYPLARYATPEDFARYKEMALAKGFRHVASAPLARSSYRAWEVMEDVHDLY